MKQIVRVIKTKLASKAILISINGPRFEYNSGDFGQAELKVSADIAHIIGVGF